MYNNNLFLKNGSKVAIIGGGPAGSFFAHFASQYATEMGIDISITIFDRKLLPDGAAWLQYVRRCYF
jgi:2-polyprenyl-6-methoxyphenol hydroxylase-like FAD-dependent oxidoreductase